MKQEVNCHMQPTLYSNGALYSTSALFAQNPHELCNRSAVNNVNKTDASVYCDLSVLEPDNSTYHLACVAGGALRSLYDAVSDGATRFLKRIYKVSTAMDQTVSPLYPSLWHTQVRRKKIKKALMVFRER